MYHPLRLAVLASGQGTNLQAFIDAIDNKELVAEIALVISDQSKAYALTRAKAHNINTLYVDYKNFASREVCENNIAEIIKNAGVDLILLAGFMRILSPTFLSHFSGRVLNIHPSLLPAFPGINAQGQALHYGVKVTGCTVHFVDEGLDTGPIVLQAAVPVLPGDSCEELAQRILQEEHRIYPEAVRLFQAGRLKQDGRRVIILPKEV